MTEPKNPDVRSFWAAFVPPPPAIGWGERVRGALGAALGIVLIGFVSAWWMGAGSSGLPFLIAPMGASAVLLFAVPASPLAQPWPIIGGNLIAALIGVTAARTIADPVTASALALGLSIAAMSALRCVHPPSGAVALTAVLGGGRIAAAGYGFVLEPVLLNSLLLMIVAIAFNTATGHSYPHRAHATAKPAPDALTPADFDAVLAEYGETLDIDAADLRALYEDLRRRA
ncbi:HPP family protein [Sphingomonas sp. NFR15]|uniref:HPP family protein n=1 Tax=Sphingomonas sp. NFR15 TaxID=1566282 RepID=UPI00088E8D35|nr:HPP family protein [Sphingomonas sp. NFR15]SDA15561.1 HPP family protein [Sphingomonas sp. NFR15]